MSQTATTVCLQTTLKNTSSRMLRLGFLARGLNLAAGDTANVNGDPVGRIFSEPGLGRHRKGLENLLESGDLQILSSPAVFLYDPVLAHTKQLALHNGQLGLVDPCWESAGSSAFAAG